jgi:hypothetical protein
LVLLSTLKIGFVSEAEFMNRLMISVSACCKRSFFSISFIVSFFIIKKKLKVEVEVLSGVSVNLVFSPVIFH